MSSAEGGFTIALWEESERAIRANFHDQADIRECARAAAVALLRRLAEEMTLSEEDDEMWPDSDDLLLLADELEAS